MLGVLKIQTALRSFVSPATSSTITSNSKSSHARTAYVKSRLFPGREPRSFAEWEVDVIGCARKLDREGAEARSLIQEGIVKEIAVYGRKKDAGQEYVLAEIVNAQGAQICLLKFERERMEVHTQSNTEWATNDAMHTAVTCTTDQVITRRRRLSAPALENRRTSLRAMGTQWKRTRSNGAKPSAPPPAYVPIPGLKQTITRRDTVFSTRVHRSDKLHRIFRYGRKGPRVLDLFVVLSTIDKCEQKAIGHGRRWFVTAFLSTLQGLFLEKRVWFNKDARIKDSSNGKEAGVDEHELQMFLEDFVVRKARTVGNLQAWHDATESARSTPQICTAKKHVARQDVWLEREIEHARGVEAEAWRRTYKSLEAVEEARLKLQRAEEEQTIAEEERKKAEESRSKTEARFAVVEAESERLRRLDSGI